MKNEELQIVFGDISYAHTLALFHISYFIFYILYFIFPQVMKQLFTFFCLFLVISSAVGQSRRAEYELALLRSMQDGSYEGLECGHSHRDFPNQTNGRFCGLLNQGYGTNGWLPASNNGHPLGNSYDNNCVVPALPVPACGFYAVPLAITVFENAAHVGTNYLGGAGFAALTDADIDAALVTLNSYYANANIRFYEAVPRRRITDVDMYDFYTPFLGGADPVINGNNGVDDDGETVAFDRTDIINLYFVGGLNGVHGPSGTTGYAPLPSSRDYSIMAYRALFGSTLYHELGHYLGLFHTHNNVASGDDNPQFPPEDALNNSDCLSKGDMICDTWPDPNFTGCRVPACTYQTTPAPPCGVLTINAASGTNFGGGVSTILQRNIMNYNSFSGCRQDFSPCQYRKLHDVLLGCRNNLCDTSVARHFANTILNDANSPYKSICVGGAIPTFTAVSGCYNWYDVPTGGAPLATATNSFTPTPAQLNVNASGITFFYIEALNSYNATCRQAVYVIVSARSGNGREQTTLATTIALAGSLTDTARVETNGAALGTNQVVGWWLTVDNPIATTATNQATLNAALATATVNAAVSNSNPNHVFLSAGAAHSLNLGLNCNLLDPARDYFLTPFVSSQRAAVADVNCVVNLPVGNITVSGNAGKRATLAIGGVGCRPATPPNSPTFTLTLTVAGYTGAAGNLLIRIRNNATCALPNDAGGLVAGNGTYVFTQANFAAGFDPSTTGWCILAFENGGAGMDGAATLTASLNITYPGLPAINFPTVDYTNCLFGNPVTLRCPNNIGIAVGAGCMSGIQAGVSGNAWFDFLNGSGRIIASINPRGNDLGTVEIEVNDMPLVETNSTGLLYLPRYFNIESSNFGGFAMPFPAGAVDVRLYFLQEELDAYNLAGGTNVNVGSLTINHYAADIEDCLHSNNNAATMLKENIAAPQITHSIYNSTSGAGHRLDFGLNHFSELEISGNSVLLANSALQSFIGNISTEGILLRWWLRPQAMLARVTLQRADASATFEDLADVPYLQGRPDYSYLDQMPLAGDNYYRLAIQQATGDIEYSNILHFSLPMQNKISLLPNPLENEGTLVYYAEKISNDQLDIIDATGKICSQISVSTNVGMNYHRISTQALSAGVYTLRLRQGKYVRTLRFVKTTR
jgi:hypothetical protein